MRHPDKAKNLEEWDVVNNDWDIKIMRAISVGCRELDGQTKKELIAGMVPPELEK